MKRTAAPPGSSASGASASGASGATELDLASLLAPPAGMRDLLPPESRARRKVSEQLQRVYEGYGYELITPPLFERVEVFERGLTLDPRDLMRFVEPDSGEVVALRPDITPQIARIVATRLKELPPPFRVRYEGTLVRRRRGRARRQRQIAQVGVELIGLDSAEADAEVVRATAEACRAAGLSEFRVELAEVGVGRALLMEHGEALFREAADALAQKDEALLVSLLDRAGVARDARDRIARLLHLHGDLSVLAEARKLVAGTPASPHLDSLERVAELLFDAGLGPQLGVDLGEVRGAGYYTGVSFALFARGPGEVIASGGRYDQLLARYGRELPATGAAIFVENLLWALDHKSYGWRDQDVARFAVAGEEGPRVRRVAEALRAHGVPTSTLPGVNANDALQYASAWGLDACVVVREGGSLAFRSADKQQRELAGELSPSDIDALLAWARAAQKE
ncbi:MAG TPA: ATP phosphoribosyltransferase regulatory subunit [Polyangiales bacterium]